VTCNRRPQGGRGGGSGCKLARVRVGMKMEPKWALVCVIQLNGANGGN